MLVLVLVLVIEKNSRFAATLAGTEQLRKDRAFFSADGQQIEDEHEQEHEHDSANFGIWIKESGAPLQKTNKNATLTAA